MKKSLIIGALASNSRCSSLVSIPVINAMGIDTAFVPTMLLSTHTSYKDVFKQSTVNFMANSFAHFLKEGFQFDSYFIGYLGTVTHFEPINHMIKGGLVLIDPILGDDGKPYSGIDFDYLEKMKLLIKKATCITPNMTEACLLTGVEYKGVQDKATVEEILKRLAKMTDAHIVITSCNLNNNMGVISSKDNSIKFYQIDKQEASSFGAGDLFSAVMFGCLKLGKNMDESIKTAIKFTSMCLEETIKTRSTYEGIVFHSKLKELQKLI